MIYLFAVQEKYYTNMFLLVKIINKYDQKIAELRRFFFKFDVLVKLTF